MKFTCFASLYDTRPRTYEGWEEFAAQLNQPVITSNKKSVRLYSPAVYIDGAATRSNANVSYLSFLVADCDDATEDQVLELLQGFEDCQISVFFHTTHSFAEGVAEGKFKCRIIVPAHRIMVPDEWDRIWLGFREFCLQLSGVEIDNACKDPSRSYFFPSAPHPEDCLVEYFDGGPIDVDLLLEYAPPVPQKSAFKAPSAEALARIESTTRFQLARALLTTYEPAVEGQGGDRMTYRAGCVGNDFALTKEEFWPLFLEYNTRCSPPWSEEDLEKKLDNAYQYASMPKGWRLVGEGEDDAVTADDLGKLVTKLQRKASRAATGRILRSMLTGAPLAGTDPGTSLRKVSDVLAYEYPRADPKQLAELFQECIEKSNETHRDINLDAFATLIKTHQEDLQAAAVANRMHIHEAVAARYAQAFRSIGISRQTPYTDEELENFKKQFPNPGEAEQLWIVRHDSTFYFRVEDQYVGPFRKDAYDAGQILLSPSKIEFKEYNDRGMKPRSLSSLVEEYGSVAHNVVLDMTAQKSTYEPETFTLTEAPCPMRDIKPKFHENVDRWVSALCGGDNELYNRFLDWLACVPEVKQPTCALVIYGAAQTGKSLLGSALARIWTTAGVTEIEDVVGSFNSMQASCPVVLADETVPQEGGKPNTRLLRKIITQHERTFRRKNIPDAKLLGAMRLVMTSNSLDGLIYQHDELNDHDIEALCERFLLIRVRDNNAKKFLDSLPPKERMAITHYTAIAEHVLHLWKTRKFQWGKRLLVEGFQESELANALKAGTGLRPEVIEFVAEWLIHPERITKTHYQPLIETLADGQVVALMSAKTIKEHWTSIHGDKSKTPRLQNISRALQALSTTIRRVDNKTYYQLDLKAILQHAAEIGMDVYAMNQGLLKLGITPVQFIR